MKSLYTGTLKHTNNLSAEMALQINGIAATVTLAADALLLIRVQIGSATGPLAGGERIQVSAFVQSDTGDNCRMAQYCMDVPVGEDFIMIQLQPFWALSGEIIVVKALSSNILDISIGSKVWIYDAQPLQAATPNNALDVESTGEAGLNFDNVKNASDPKTLTNITIPIVSDLTGHTPQTGDSYAIVAWVKAVMEGDAYIDTTQTPWQLVIHKKSDANTEYIRKGLKDPGGNNIISADVAIGRHVEPA